VVAVHRVHIIYLSVVAVPVLIRDSGDKMSYCFCGRDNELPRCKKCTLEEEKSKDCSDCSVYWVRRIRDGDDDE
jgi:hypothetical protein